MLRMHDLRNIRLPYNSYQVPGSDIVFLILCTCVACEPSVSLFLSLSLASLSSPSVRRTRVEASAPARTKFNNPPFRRSVQSVSIFFPPGLSFAVMLIVIESNKIMYCSVFLTPSRTLRETHFVSHVSCRPLLFCLPCLYFSTGVLTVLFVLFFPQRQLSTGGSGRGRRRRWRRSRQQACSRRKCQEISARPPGEPKARQLQLVEGSQACRPLAEFLSDEKRKRCWRVCPL